MNTFAADAPDTQPKTPMVSIKMTDDSGENVTRLPYPYPPPRALAPLTPEPMPTNPTPVLNPVPSLKPTPNRNLLLTWFLPQT